MMIETRMKRRWGLKRSVVRGGIGMWRRRRGSFGGSMMRGRGGEFGGGGGGFCLGKLGGGERGDERQEVRRSRIY